MDSNKNNSIFKKHFKIIDYSIPKVLPDNSYNAIVARAGTGKTALIVQLAIDAILQKKKVLHVSLSEGIDKVDVWYKEVLNNLKEIFNPEKMEALKESIISHRLIMTFKIEKFNVLILKERLKDLTKQQIFDPSIIIIDGLPFDDYVAKPLKDLKIFSEEENLNLWFTIITHRHEMSQDNNLPSKLARFNNFFDNIIQLQPKNNKIHIKSLKSKKENNKDREYFLDPSTMLIQNI